MKILTMIRANVRISKVDKLKILLKLIEFLFILIEWKQQSLNRNELELIMKEKKFN